MNKAAHISRRSSPGFTLIEVMVAMTILSMTLLLLFGSLYAANKYWKISAAAIERTDEIRIASQFIRQRLSQAIPILWLTSDQRRLLFHGERRQLKFISTLPSHRGGGLYSLILKTAQTDSGPQLGITYKLLVPDKEPFDFPRSEEQEFVVLANNVTAITFSYFGNTERSDEPRWHDSWEHSEQLPQLVRIKISTTEGQIIWPTMEVPVHAPIYLDGQPQFIIHAKTTT